MGENEDRDAYVEKIIEIINKVTDVWILKQIYRCAKNITKEG